jgi:deazaflavin-dependent oxidoreductase (nitroreductase family)
VTDDAGLDPLNPIDNATPWVAKQISAYVASDGEHGSTQRGAPLLLLTTRGRKSGRWRRTALIFGQVGDNYLVVASMGGAPKHPSWYLNLTVHPEVHLQVYDRKFTATARTASAEEKPILWRTMVEIWPDYANYQVKTDREIPVIVLEPVAD